MIIILKVARDMFLDRKGHNYLKRLCRKKQEDMCEGYISMEKED